MSHRAGLGWRPLAAYGMLRAPLALVELPLFVLLPAFYSRSQGLDLTLIGAVLFFTRLLDAVADPLIGTQLDRHRDRQDERRWIALALPVLALGFAGMFLPPVSGDAAAAWLALTSMVTYLAYSVVSIAYQAWGSALGQTPSERARVTAMREGFGLAGVLAASALLAPDHARTLIVCFVLLSALAWRMMRHAPAPPRPDGGEAARAGAAPRAEGPLAGAWAAWRDVLGNPLFRWLLAAFVLNGVATAIPATLVLFFTRDVLGADESQTAVLLVSYFLAGALGMPLWTRLARRFGLRNAWLLGMAFAVLAFMWALGLGRGDLLGFGMVCVLTGLALGSDLVMPPALLAALIADAGHAGRREGAYFGVWSLATKLNLALAAGLALPMLAWLGYVPGRNGDTLALALTYAAVPSALKLAAGLIVLLAPLPESISRDPAPPEKAPA